MTRITTLTCKGNDSRDSIIKLPPFGGLSIVIILSSKKKSIVIILELKLDLVYVLGHWLLPDLQVQ